MVEPQEKEYHLTIPISQLNIGKFVVASSTVYMVENILYYPFDLVRTKQQVQRDSGLKTWGLVKSLGFRGLYTGFWASTVGSLPSHGIYFLSYNIIKDKLQEIDNGWHPHSTVKGKQALWVSFSAGALADIIANAFVVPVEVVVQRLQIQEPNSAKKYNEAIGLLDTVYVYLLSNPTNIKKHENDIQKIRDAMKVIYNTEGIRGFYRGFGVTILTYAPASAIWWMTYEQSKILFADYLFTSSQHKSNDSSKIIVEQSIGAQILAGGIAGILTATITNPLDVVKTRLQTQHHHIQIENDKVKALYANTWGAFKQMAKEEGLRSFGKGIVPRVVTSAFFSSWFGFIYEAVLEFSKK